MREWHYMLLPYLPTSQLVANKREFDLKLKDFFINKKNTNHILINYTHKYGMSWWAEYYAEMYREFMERGFKFNDKYKLLVRANDTPKFLYKEHDEEYLKICYWNLHEKYIRGQKDFSRKEFIKLQNFVFSQVKDWTPRKES